MRKIIHWGLLATLLATAVSYWATTPWKGQTSGAIEHEPPFTPNEPAVVSGEPGQLDTLPSDSAEPTTSPQSFEAIDLLRPEQSPNPATGDAASCEHGPQAGFAQGFVPVESIRSADEADCLRSMPHSEATSSVRGTPRTVEDAQPRSNLGGSEEQSEPTEPAIDSRSIEERLKCVIQSYLQEGKWGPAAVDTLEFRPSDAKKGEFDRVPF